MLIKTFDNKSKKLKVKMMEGEESSTTNREDFAEQTTNFLIKAKPRGNVGKDRTKSSVAMH